LSAAAEVIDLEVARAQRGRPLAFGWGSLGLDSDARDFVARYFRLGLAPLVLYGIADDGTCMCGRGAACGKSAGKHPLLSDWQNRAPDRAEIEKILARNWRWNLGLRMGLQPSGVTLITIDVDGDLSLLEPIEQANGAKFPPTLTAKTSRGYHLIYRVPAGVTVRNKQKLSPGIDTRADGGLIVASPSRHQSGARYRWIDAREPEVLT
jgi:hypothetical protein